MSETSSRLLELLSLLQARRDWQGEELAARLEVSARTIRRDVERLRRLGYPVESLSGCAGGYRLRAGSAMPPLLLDDEEAIAIAVGLRTAARASVRGIEETAVRALVKLEQVLPPHLRRRVQTLGAATVVLPAPGPTVDPQHLTVIAAACRDRERLRFAYRRRDGVASRREVEPHSLLNRGQRWYLVAWDREREDWRTFRLDRLNRPAPAGVRFAPRPLPAKDAAAYVQQSISAAPSRYEAVITLHAPAREVAERIPRQWGALQPLDAHTCRFTAGDDDLRWLAMRIAMLDVDFEVQAPPELVEHLQALAGRLGRATGRVAPATSSSTRRGP
ncbi:MAG TPA: YafY family protein [Solirubrobacteraceae bacterium]|jgi:predicted DNA-binding transcriptional regulator YafY|nr:YafY family protein [Solirubrobacteraceae bacterium]